jgi:hypothetical protein
MARTTRPPSSSADSDHMEVMAQAKKESMDFGFNSTIQRYESVSLCVRYIMKFVFYKVGDQEVTGAHLHERKSTQDVRTT